MEGLPLKSTVAAPEQLINNLAQHDGCVVAFSGGVDSAVVAKAAVLALGERALAVTGVSASLSDTERDVAIKLARTIGIEHEIVATEEFANPDYLANAPDRCWHCKDELYAKLQVVAERRGLATIVNGANRDDVGDFRPGMQAARERQVRSPLLECGFDKQAVRELARHWGLEVAQKPASPCLSSRVVYGLEIDDARLSRVASGEAMLRELGLVNCRVRHHHDELARIEVPLADLPVLCEPFVRQELVRSFRELGFRYVTLDLEGFRSGSFQQLIPTEELERYRQTPQM